MTQQLTNQIATSSGFSEIESHIHVLKENTPDYEPGFYFSDETGDLHGPVSTLEEAKANLKMYAENL